MAFPMSWGTISGQECHDAGGREGIGNLFIHLENALLPQMVLWKGHPQPMDFIVMCVPTEMTKTVLKDMEMQYGSPSIGRN